MAGRGGVISASIIVLALVATAIGTVVGLMLDGIIPGTRALAIAAGLIATLIASVARYKVVYLGAGKGADEARIPTVILVNAAIASVAGSLAAHDLALYVSSPPPSVLMGALAGLLSAVLMAMLMVTYHRNPSQMR